MNETGRMAAFHMTGTVEGSLAWYDEPLHIRRRAKPRMQCSAH